jgi:hypothetical protein
MQKTKKQVKKVTEVVALNQKWGLLASESSHGRGSFPYSQGIAFIFG